MRVAELSNHPGDMLHDATRQRLAAGKRAQEGYEDALIKHQARVQTMRVQRERARHQNHWWTWLRLAFGGWAERRRRPRPPPAPAAASRSPSSAWWCSPTAGLSSATAGT